VGARDETGPRERERAAMKSVSTQHQRPSLRRPHPGLSQLANETLSTLTHASEHAGCAPCLSNHVSLPDLIPACPMLALTHAAAYQIATLLLVGSTFKYDYAST
jgi:hypothetical protein